MGGPVVENALNLSKDAPDLHLESIYQYTFAIAFLRTPHSRPDLAY
jgi:hypothetical protein